MGIKNKDMKLKILLITICISALIVGCSNNNNDRPRKNLNPKIWLHRANDTNKAKYFQDKYSGMEIDVFFDESRDTFVIKHDEGENSDITIEEWLSSIENPTDIGLWLDLKNLTSTNKNAIVSRLKLIRKEFNLKGKIYVESDNCDDLDVFKNEGFSTSYYIPWYAADSIAETLRETINKNKQKTISGYHDKYDFMKRQFPDTYKLIWYHEHDTAKRNYYINLANSEEKIDVLLVADDFNR